MTAPAGTLVAVAAGGAEGSVEHYLAEYRALARELPGGSLPWLAGLRQAAIDRFAELGFPGPRDEHWKYTRVAPIQKRAFRTPGKLCIGLDEDDIGEFLFPGLLGPRLVFVNGRYTPQLSRLGGPQEGVWIASLAKALAEAPEMLEPYLARHADAGAHGFTALNTAFLADGALVHLAPGAVSEEPIHLLYLSTAREGDTVAHPRNLIVAGPNSRAQIIESYASLGEAGYFSNAVTEVVMGENAGLEYYRVQQESHKAFHIATLQVHQSRNSRFTAHAASFGAQLARTDINVLLAAEGAECTLNGLYMIGGRQHVDFHTTVDHAKPHGTSREYFKGILDGHARGVFNGRVHVHPDAQKTDSAQSNNNLLLSRNAEVDSKPELEIYADDVKCSHGATVGQLDEDMLFYLRARGIDAAAARGLLTYGFAQDVIDRMSLAPVRGRLEDVLVSRVPDAEHVKEML